MGARLEVGLWAAEGPDHILCIQVFRIRPAESRVPSGSPGKALQFDMFYSVLACAGVTSEPSFAVIVPANDIATAPDGATTVTLHVTLPSSNIGAHTRHPEL